MEKEGGGEQLFGVVAVVLLRDAARTVSAAHRDARGPRPCIDSLHFITSRPSPPVYCMCDVYQGFSLFSPSLRVQQQLEKYLKKKKKKLHRLYRRRSHNCCVQIIMKKRSHSYFVFQDIFLWSFLFWCDPRQLDRYNLLVLLFSLYFMCWKL